MALCVLCRTTCVSVVHISRYICICISHKLSGGKNTRTCVNIFYWVFLFTRRSRSLFLAKTNQARRREQAQRYHISQSQTHTLTLKQRQTLLGTWEPIRIPIRIPLPHSHSHSDVSARIIAAHFYECYMA